MNAYEKIPDTLPDQPFPLGDIPTTHLADEFCHMVDTEDWGDLMSYVDKTYVTTESDTYVTYMNHLMAEELCIRWDNDNGGNNFSKTGFKLARSLIRMTDLLPPYDAELRLTLIRMKHEIVATNFARSAWLGMRYSYPKVHAYHDRILTRATEQINLGAGNNTELFIAGLSLPYVLSVASSVSHALKSYEHTLD